MNRLTTKGPLGVSAQMTIDIRRISERGHLHARRRFLLQLTALGLLCLLVAGCGGGPARPARPGLIILLRHAEKPDNEADGGLSTEGEESARALVGFFTNTPVLMTNGLPAALYACKISQYGRGRRPYDTLAPLSKAFGLPIQTPYRSNKYAELAAALLGDGTLHGKTVVICWTHTELPLLARALGVAPPDDEWKGYGRVWMITYPDGQPRVEEIQQRL